MTGITLNDIRAMKDDFITAAQAASVMKMNTSRLAEYARKGMLPFPIVLSGNRTKISRKAFLEWADGKQSKEPENEGNNELLKELICELKEMNRQLSIHNLLITSAVSKYSPASLAIFSDRIKELEES